MQVRMLFSPFQPNESCLGKISISLRRILLPCAANCCRRRVCVAFFVAVAFPRKEGCSASEHHPSPIVPYRKQFGPFPNPELQARLLPPQRHVLGSLVIPPESNEPLPPHLELLSVGGPAGLGHKRHPDPGPFLRVFPHPGPAFETLTGPNRSSELSGLPWHSTISSPPWSWDELIRSTGALEIPPGYGFHKQQPECWSIVDREQPPGGFPRSSGIGPWKMLPRRCV
ncbi:hypothetical protein QBC41DRAFT_313064 [Cercophora samala]|uniref:Uncharacterized protein n=1 Tax=Cercophora samala TaxID=330535 RepID=A0AA39ZLA8_9PEZI|nr:hypothetical protein QBC41DRAFT_313064 [Cercophora samala]